MNKCKRIQDRLAANGPGALREDLQAQEHLVECEACYRFLENLDQVEQGLASLPPLDAPDEVVAQLLERDELLEPVTTAPRRKPWYRSPLFADKRKRSVRFLVWGGGGLVSASLLMALVMVSPEHMSVSSFDDSQSLRVARMNLENEEAAPVLTPEESKAFESLGYVSGPSLGSDDVGDLAAHYESGKPLHRFSPPLPTEVQPDLPVERIAALREMVGRKDGVQDADGDGNPNVQGSRDRDFKAIVGGVSNLESSTSKRLSENSIEEMEVITGGAGVEYTDLVAGEGGSFYFDGYDSDEAGLYSGMDKKKRALAKNKAAEDDQRTGGKSDNEKTTIANGQVVLQSEDSARDVSTSKIHDGREVAQDMVIAEARLFMEERNTTEGLDFREATGYWSNRYLPGDPLMRLLQARLGAGSMGFDGQALHAAARPTVQPLDAPRHAALSMQLQADRRATEGPLRTLIQVGIKGIDHQGGRRPAMNLAVVLHVNDDTSDEVATSMRAIADALNAVRRPGDRFRLIVSGEPGGVIVDADRFRHGELRVALSRLFDADDELDGPEWDLFEALNKAIGLVAQDDDPKATLGTSAVLIVTGRGLESDQDRLNALAHRSAVAGIPVGAVAVGANVDPGQLERLTVSGQGRFGILLRPADAESLIDRELAAVSRAVARAVRLRIRLAPGVELVDVIGSHRLDERTADRVRQSEQSLDLRLARNLGITADRGEDEDGIQIVIPNFYASDEHVILLDVVASGPGPLVDVTARFKDLVHLKNGTVRASLGLERGPDVQGRRELNVLKNYLAHELSQRLRLAGRALTRGENTIAEGLLHRHELLLTGLARMLPTLANDPEIAADLAMLASYRNALARPEITPEQMNWLADSLRYASGARLHTPHTTERNPS